MNFPQDQQLVRKFKIIPEEKGEMVNELIITAR